jgi:hypothetical protein
MQAKRAQKRLAKLKMKQLQMAGAANKGKGTGFVNNEEDSDGDNDEDVEQINQVLHEFTAVRVVIEKLFNFLNKFVFESEKNAVAMVGTYPDLEALVRVTMVESENYLIRGTVGTHVRQMIVGCSGVPALSQTMK